ncbi:prepilin peptidase [Streptomonospora nanhaiensis]|uniref:Leader peptidase (Prepilin peptidase)/N-methyltransferase n=1 Tax=Streptomonospora nanhaiensis TaxID=1323731 RepID=A0A853BJG2_9ACTN|nr:A24 family peptidase [Streptomonospora nanhaiensis]MBV2362475.1 A24 family peptidase [Streptomonospora nanhaiensis]MBX9389064.1 A24 family peptidase [Streptomonospora nanhaiensis]NYI94865.1 leader peptidase (prepilin peptidase)/N-methyltransferase [Streptomonospora nanhaiensis]
MPALPALLPGAAALPGAAPAVPLTGLGPADLLLAAALAALGAVAGAAGARVVPLFARHDPGPADDTPPPPPTCPHCARPVPFHRLLPVPRGGAVALRGRCPSCAARLAAPPGLSAATAVLFAAAGLSLGVEGAARAPLWLAALLLFAALGALLSAVDIRVHRLPNALVLAAYPAAVALVAGAALLAPLTDPAAGPGPLDPAGLVGPLGGMAALSAFYWLLWFVHPAGMGWGDVKLAGLVGLHLGWLGFGAVFSGTFVAFLGSAAYGLALILLGRATRRTQIPFGPFMIGGALAVLLVGDPSGLLF